MEVRVLGPIEAEDETGGLALGGPKQRLLLALLALEHPAAVPSARLSEALWGDDAPRTAAKTIQVFVARLRKALGPDVIATRDGGYALALPADALDHRRFERLAAEGARALADGETAGARDRLAAALREWRGPPLGDLVVDGRALQAVRALEEQRLVCQEQRLTADLALGRAAEVVGELERLVAAEPLRERPAELLVLALYRAGRQAEALDVFRRVRRTLVEEAGIEPGPRLRALQAAVLAQDEALLGPAPSSRPPGRPPRADPPPPQPVAPARVRRSRRRPVLAAAGVLLVAGAVAAAGAREERGVVRLGPDRLVAIDADSAQVVQAFDVGRAPVAVAAGLGGVWVASAGEQTVERVDPRSGEVTARVGVGRLPSAIAVGEGAVWVASAVGDTGMVARVEPESSAVVERLTVRRGNDGDDFGPPTPSTVVAAHGALWVNRVRSRVVRVPLDGGRPRITRLAGAHSADGLAAGEDAIWLASSADDRVLRLDRRSGRLTASVPVAGRPGRRLAGPLRLAVGAGAVWAVDTLADSVSRIDPRLAAVTATIPVGRRPTHIAATRAAVWVLSADDDTIARVDAAAGRVTARVRVPGATALTATADRVWVTTGGGRAARGGAAPRGAARPMASGACSRPSARTGDVLIVSDLPTWGGGRRAPVVRDMRRAIGDVLERRGHRAGRHRVVLQHCDDSERATQGSSPRRCATNARAYAGNQRLVGVVGPYHSSCAMLQLATLNAAPGGPVPMVSASTTYPGLTRAGPATAADEPDRHQPTGLRSFFRTVSPDDVQGLALVELMRSEGIRRPYLLDDELTSGHGVARYVRAAARRRGLGVAGSARWPEDPRRLAALVDRVAAVRPDAVLLAGCFCTGGYEVLAALRRRLPAGTRYFGSDAMAAPIVDMPLPHPATDGLRIALAGRAAEAAGPEGRAMLERIGPGRPPASFEPYVLEAARATEALLDAIARSDGTRGSVLDELHAQGFTRSGDPATAIFSVLRFDRRAPVHRHRETAGLVFERVIHVRPGVAPRP